jgi:hypothetical protein
MNRPAIRMMFTRFGECGAAACTGQLRARRALAQPSPSPAPIASAVSAASRPASAPRASSACGRRLLGRLVRSGRSVGVLGAYTIHCFASSAAAISATAGCAPCVSAAPCTRATPSAASTSGALFASSAARPASASATAASRSRRRDDSGRHRRRTSAVSSSLMSSRLDPLRGEPFARALRPAIRLEHGGRLLDGAVWPRARCRLAVAEECVEFVAHAVNPRHHRSIFSAERPRIAPLHAHVLALMELHDLRRAAVRARLVRDAASRLQRARRASVDASSRVARVDRRAHQLVGLGEHRVELRADRVGARDDLLRRGRGLIRHRPEHPLQRLEVDRLDVEPPRMHAAARAILSDARSRRSETAMPASSRSPRIASSVSNASRRSTGSR